MSNIVAMCNDWIIAKREEQAAQKRRHAIEAQLSQAFEVKTQGAITHRVEGYKVLLSQPVNIKLDPDKWALVAHHCPSEWLPVRWVLQSDPAGVNWLRKNQPDVYAKIAPAFEIKPGKIGVKVEEA